MELSSLIQLATGFNIAGITAYHLTAFKNIIESAYPTQALIDKRKESIVGQFKVVEKTLEEYPNVNVNTNATYSLLKQTKDKIEDLLNNKIDNNLKSEINEKCHPKYMTGICAMCAILGFFIMSLFAIEKDYPNFYNSAFHVCIILFFIGVVIFGAIKMHIMMYLFHKIGHLKKDPKDIIREKHQQSLQVRHIYEKLWLRIHICFLARYLKTENKLRKIYLDSEIEKMREINREKAKKSRMKFGKILNTTWGVIIGLFISVISIFIAFFMQDVINGYTENINKNIIIGFEFMSVFLMYSSFIFYIMLNFIFLHRRNRLLNVYFEEPKRLVSESIELSRDLQGALKVARDNRKLDRLGALPHHIPAPPEPYN